MSNRLLIGLLLGVPLCLFGLGMVGGLCFLLTARTCSRTSTSVATADPATAPSPQPAGPTTFPSLPLVTEVTPAANRFSVAWVGATRLPDQTIQVTLRVMNPPSMDWDKLTVNGELRSRKPDRGPWAARVLGTLPDQGVPEQVDVNFITDPVADPIDDLGFHFVVRLESTGIWRSGMCSMSFTAALPGARQ